MENIVITQLSIPEFKEIIRDVYIDVNREQKKSEPTPDQKEYLTRKETAKRLNISLVTLYHWTNRGLVDCHKIGSRILYKWEEVQAAVKKRDKIIYRRA